MNADGAPTQSSAPISTLFVNHSSGFGGAERSLIQLVGALDHRRILPYVITRPPNTSTFAQQARRAGATMAYTHVPVWLRDSYERRGPIRKLYRLYMQQHHIQCIARLCALIRRWRIDVVVTNMAFSPHPAIAAWIMGIPHVWHVREILDADFDFVLSPTTIAKTISRLSHKVVCNSQAAAQIFYRAAQDRTRIEVVYNGIDAPLGDASARHTLRRQLGIADTDVVIGMVANVTSAIKRHDLFLQVAAQARRRMPETRFVVFGALPDKSDAHWGRLRDLQRQLGDNNLIIWAGFVADPNAIMASLDVLLHPTPHESFGRIVGEALMNQRPVIAVNRGGVPEIADASCAILVDPDDIESMTKAVCLLAHDPQLRMQMGLRGRKRIEKHFSTQVYVDGLQRIIEQAAKTS